MVVAIMMGETLGTAKGMREWERERKADSGGWQWMETQETPIQQRTGEEQ